MNAAKVMMATILGIILIILVVVGGYLGGWWLKTDVNNRQAHLNRTTFEQQATYRDDMTRQIQTVKAVDVQIAQAGGDASVSDPLKAQRVAIVNIVCKDDTHINGGLDQATAAFVAQECA